MLKTFLNSFRVAEIRKKLAFTAAMLLLYRVGAYIPAPGINVDAVKDISENFTGSNVLGFLNLFSGGSLQRFAIFALGIMPYITASIILQLMTVVVPSLEKLRKEGEVGQQKITQYTRYLTVGLAFGQSIGYVFLFRSFSTGSADVVDNFTFGRVFVIVTTLTAGCVLLMWLGELITQRGIGNGISLMIFASIVAGPAQRDLRLVDQPRSGVQGDDALPGRWRSSPRSCSSRRASGGSRCSTPSASWAAGCPAAARPTCRCG